MGLSGGLGRRFGQDAVARVRTQWGLGGLGLGRWALRCAALLSDVVGTKTRRAGARRNGKGKTATQDAGLRERGWLWREREGERDGQT